MKECVFRLAHISDAHLGFRQYGLGTRREDFRKAFEQCINRILEEEVNVLLLCGDTFHSEKPDFIDLIYMRDTIKRLKSKNVDIVAITGNHDKEGYGDFCSWIDLFEDVRNLDPDWNVPSPDWLVTPLIYESGGLTFAIYGLNWTRDIETKISTKILPSVAGSTVDINILAIHAGVEKILPQDRGMISEEFMSEICKSSWKVKAGMPSFDYVALGHIHKPYQRYDGYNPGSLENCSTEEWDYIERGFNIIDFYNDGTKKVQKYCPVNRETKKIRIPVSMNSTQEHLNYSAREKLNGIGEGALIQVELFGSVGEQIKSTTINNLKTFIYNTFHPLHIRIKDVSYVSKRINDQNEVVEGNNLEEIYKKVFGEDSTVAETVAQAVLDGKEVTKIIEIVEENSAQDQQDTTL